MQSLIRSKSAVIMFSLLKYFLAYSAIIAMKFGHLIPEGLKMMIL